MGSTQVLKNVLDGQDSSVFGDSPIASQGQEFMVIVSGNSSFGADAAGASSSSAAPLPRSTKWYDNFRIGKNVSSPLLC